MVAVLGSRFLLTQDKKSWSHNMTNVSIRGEYVENSSTLAVSVPINLFTEVGTLSVNGLSESYFVDTLRLK